MSELKMQLPEQLVEELYAKAEANYKKSCEKKGAIYEIPGIYDWSATKNYIVVTLSNSYRELYKAKFSKDKYLNNQKGV